MCKGIAAKIMLLFFLTVINFSFSVSADPSYIKSLIISDANGDTVYALQSGEINITADINTGIQYRLMAALYNKGELKGVYNAVQNNEKQQISVSNISGNLSEQWIKVFLWNESLKPIGNSYIISVNGISEIKEVSFARIAYDGFNDKQLYTLPENWYSPQAREICSVITDSQANAAVDSCMRIKRTTTDDTAFVSRKFPRSSGVLSLQMKLKTEQLAYRKDIIVLDSTNNMVINLYILNGTIYASDGNTDVTIGNYSSNLWFDLKILLDTDTSKYDVYVNKVLKKENIAFKNISNNINQVVYSLSASNAGSIYIDDFSVSLDYRDPYLKILPVQNQPAIYSVPGYNPNEITTTKQLGSWTQTNLQPQPLGDVYEIENMKLYNFEPLEIGGRNAAVVSEQGKGWAKFRFEGESGYYSVNVGYFDLISGYNSTYRLLQNNIEIDYWLAQFGDSFLHVRNSKYKLYVNHGDLFTIEGLYGENPSTISYVEFATPRESNFKVGRLISDHYRTQVGQLPSGWEIQGVYAGMKTESGMQNFYLHDNSFTEKIVATRSFIPQNSGFLTLDFRVKFTEGSNGVSFGLFESENNGISLNIINGSLYAGNNLISTITLNTYNDIRIIADFEQNLAKIFINGTLLKAEIPFSESQLNYFCIKTSNESTAQLMISWVELSAGYIMYEGFSNSSGSGKPYGFDLSETSNATANVVNYHCSPYENQYSLKLFDIDTAGYVSAEKSFENSQSLTTVQYNILISDNVIDQVKTSLYSDNDLIATVYTQSKDLYCGIAGNNYKIWGNVKPDMWYNIRMVVDSQNNTVQVYVNRMLKAESTALSNNKIPNKIKFNTGHSNKVAVLLDDIEAFNGIYDSDVPEPDIAPLKNSNYLIGVQTCDLWEEGSHFGFDMLKPYDSRTPLMGYYQDGDVTAADWDNKFMLEHGINLYFPMWYRPSLNRPIKEPILSAKLHDGFLNSKYMNYMKYAICFEANTGISSADEFKKYVVNYWIERYFKHPNYCIIDNKPVIGVFNTDKLLSSLGNSETAVAQLINDINQMLISEGFDGAIFLATALQQSEARWQSLQRCGYDYTFAYNFGSADITSQLNVFYNQTNWEGPHMIASPSPGWGQEPWGGVRKTNISLNSYRLGLEWIKNTYFNMYPSDSLASRMVLLGNWNEISEGHFILPSKLSGFGYLDEIRNTFTDAQVNHTDFVPDLMFNICK